MNLSEQIKTQISPDLQKVLELASEAAVKTSNRLVMVGGVVRDLVLNREIFDVDLMADHPAQNLVEHLAKQLNGNIKSHSKFLTFSIYYGQNKKLDVATAREESYSKPGQLPDVVPSTIEKDLKRRDFSVNAMACWISKQGLGEVVDLFEGLSDLKSKKIRVLHEASFVDDPTRVYRAARFAGRLEFEIHESTQNLIEKTIKDGGLNLLTPTRKRHEFEIIMKENDPVKIFKMLEKWGALTSFHPSWTVQKEHAENLPTINQLDAQKYQLRLQQWFKPWGRKRAEDMMTSLEFERSVKKEVLGQI